MKNKIIYIFLFAILFLFIIFIPNCSNAFSITVGDNLVSLPDLPDNVKDKIFFIGKSAYTSSDGDYFLCFYNGDNTGVSCIYNFDNELKVGFFKDNKQLTMSRYVYYSSKGVWQNLSTRPDQSVRGGNIYYSSNNIYYTNGSIYYNASMAFSITLSTTEHSSVPIQAYSNWFDMKYQGRYKCYISTDSENWLSMNIRTLNDNDSVYYGFYYDILYNGAYYFKCIDTVTNDTKSLSLNITNLKDKIDIEFYLSNTDNTTEPIYILSNKYYYTGDYNPSDNFLTEYSVEISEGYEDSFNTFINTVYGYDESEGKNFVQYSYKVLVNGIYKLKITDYITGNISYITFNINNIGYKNKYGDDVYYNNYDENGNFRPTPVLFLEYVNSTTVRIRTQPFTFNEFIMLECYTSFEDNEFTKNTNIYNYTVVQGGEFSESKIDMYYFYLDVQVDGIYYFKFYNIESKEYTQNSIDVNIKEFINNNLSNIDNFSDKMFIWARNHFGFLFYPFEFIISFLNRVLNINYSEPILTIPELREPFFNNKILDETVFNFNSILSNSTIVFVYNIYLVVVDSILIFSFISFCKHIFEEVFSR